MNESHADTSTPTVDVLVYSDDRRVREQIRVALGRRLSADLPELRVVEAATQPAVLDAMDSGKISVAIFDAEAVPSGGMGLCRQMHDEIPDCPPIMVIVAREQDAWLATWSRAEAVAAHPVDPIRLPGQVADMMRRAGLGVEANA